MGSPVSVTIANLVMEDAKERALATVETPPRFWKRYVDDTCTALPSHRINEFLDHLNSVEPSIQFTVEVESNGRLPSLMYCWNVMRMALSPLPCTGSKHTLADIWTSHHTTPWHTKSQWSRLFMVGQRPSVPLWCTKTMRLDSSGGPLM